MKELLLVGRGGEGVVLASQLLADALARAGFWVQSFPEFKAERRGAPISAFLRWDEDEPIHRRYKIRECDVLAVVTPGAVPPQALAAVRDGGLVLLNLEVRLPQTGPFEIARVPASRIAAEHGVLSSEGRPMGNVAMLGALMRLLAPAALGLLEQAITARLGRLAEPNVAAARAGYAQCRRQRTRVTDVPVVRPPAVVAAPSRPPLYPVSTTDSSGVQTGAWSLDRPVLLDACNACALCVLFCPEGAMSRTDGVMSIDLLHCKGCGICEQVCPLRNAIELQEIRA